MDNPQTLATLDTHATTKRQTEQKTQHRKLTTISNTEPTKCFSTIVCLFVLVRVAIVIVIAIVLSVLRIMSVEYHLTSSVTND